MARLNIPWMISSLTGRLKASSRDDADAAPTLPQPPVGYLTNGPHVLTGAPGIAYDYITAGNGLHAQAGNDLMVLRLPIIHAEVRGLDDVDRKVHLKHGLVPAHLFELGLRWMQTTPVPRSSSPSAGQAPSTPSKCPNSRAPEQASAISHPRARASSQSSTPTAAASILFGTDDRDEQGFRFYGVAGRLDSNTPELVLRAGIYGNFGQIDWSEVFDGRCPATINVQEHSWQPEDPHL